VDLNGIKESMDPRYRYMPALVVGMKGDLPGSVSGYEKLRNIWQDRFRICAVSSNHPESIDPLNDAIWDHLDIIRIFTKVPGKPPEDKPVVLRGEATVGKVAERIHKSFLERFRFARVWGSARFDGQKVGLDYRLQDGDIVEIHLKR